MAPCALTADARNLQRQPARIGRAASGDQQLVGAHFAVTSCKHEFPVRVGDVARLRVIQHFDALRAESGRERLADRRVFAEEKRATREDRHLAAQSRKGLRQFHRHDRRADHHQARRDRVARQRLGRGPVGRLFQARDGRNGRARAGGDQAAVECDFALAAFVQPDDQAATVVEVGVAAQHGDLGIAFENALVFGVTQFIDARLLLGEQVFRGRSQGRSPQRPRRRDSAGADGRYERRGS